MVSALLVGLLVANPSFDECLGKVVKEAAFRFRQVLGSPPGRPRLTVILFLFRGHEG